MEEGKPQDIAEKMVAGRFHTFANFETNHIGYDASVIFDISFDIDISVFDERLIDREGKSLSIYR